MVRKFKTLPIIRYYAGGMMLTLFLLLPTFIAVLIFSHIDMSAKGSIYGIIIACGLPIAGSVLIHVAFWEKCFATIVITDDAIVWKCFLRKSIKILRDDCMYVGLEYETSPLPLEYPYIYFTSFNYPDKSQKGTVKIRCKNGLIKFRYTQELAEYIMDEFSKKTTYAFCAYYREHKKL